MASPGGTNFRYTDLAPGAVTPMVYIVLSQILTVDVPQTPMFLSYVDYSIAQSR